MKISRRGKHTKHARRGRHTKRAGKHLRYKSKSKKFRASKRYHRGRGGGRVRTHKRGKRFHRGGVEDGGNATKPGKIIDFSDPAITDPTITNDNISIYPEGYTKWFSTRNQIDYGRKMDKVHPDRYGGYETSLNTLESGAYVIQFDNVPLVFTKEGFFTGTKAPGKFKVVIIEAKPIAGQNTGSEPLRSFTAILIRKDENIGKYDKDGFSLEVHFRELERNTLAKFKAMLENSKVLEKLKSNHGNNYNFNYTENKKYFKFFSNAADVLSVYVEGIFTKEQSKIKQKTQEYQATKLKETQDEEKEIIYTVENIKKLGDNFKNFGDVKRGLIQFAMTQKNRIDGATIDNNTKLFLKTQINDLLILLLLAQFTYMKILTLSSNIYNFVPEFEIFKIEDDLSKLTIDTKKFIERLGTGERQDYDYDNLKLSLEQLIKRCSIENRTSDKPNKASSDLDAEQKYKLTQEISAPSPATPATPDVAVTDAPAVAAVTDAVTEEQVVTSGPTNDNDSSFPPRI
jgi:hypothetical protein